jgi:hypothetical protein
MHDAHILEKGTALSVWAHPQGYVDLVLPLWREGVLHQWFILTYF